MDGSSRLSQVRWLYHFTDSRNLTSIRARGGLWSRAKLRANAGEFHPGGNEWSMNADDLVGMDRYVHLCLRNHHPMQFLATQDGRIQQTTWLCVDPAVLQLDGVMYTPGVSNKAGMEVIPINTAIDRIDFEVLYTRTDWSDPSIQARLQQAELCEILIPDSVPISYFERSLPNG